MRVTKDGVFTLRPVNEAISGTSIVYTSGALGTAAAAIGRRNSEGGLELYEDGILTPGQQIKIEHGLGIKILLLVSGSDGATDIIVDVARL